MTFCDECWDACPSHKKGKVGVGEYPHEKIDPEVARIFHALEETRTDEAQAKLHEIDEDARWFGVLREELDKTVLCDYGGFANLMMDRASLLNSRKYPSFVSFVGTTVVGTAQNDNTPTSSDVRLYADPQTFETNQPILYVDHEGVEGSERPPESTRKRIMSITEATAVTREKPSSEEILRKLRQTPERDIIWADTPEKSSRQHAVINLYPRLFYTFSDVVVFVFRNPKTIVSVLQQLIDWASVTLEKSCNQPVRPHAIIVFNASEYFLEHSPWDTPNATSAFLDALHETFYGNPNFKGYAQFWRERGHQIESVESLLLCYYSGISVVRIPGLDRPVIFSDQVLKLYEEITKACQESRQLKHSLRMLLDADELQTYFQHAFDQFSTKLDSPFDFVHASITKDVVPLDFKDNILNLALEMMRIRGNELDALAIFKVLSPVRRTEYVSGIWYTLTTRSKTSATVIGRVSILVSRIRDAYMFEAPIARKAIKAKTANYLQSDHTSPNCLK
ncbi:MAG: hypothetical protein M1833_006729 [Piccolia ochrophora]|nr:MAG: hypothetical protein M1833_006729 [Piccolia ochrophora]